MIDHILTMSDMKRAWTRAVKLYKKVDNPATTSRSGVKYEAGLAAEALEARNPNWVQKYPAKHIWHDPNLNISHKLCTKLRFSEFDPNFSASVTKTDYESDDYDVLHFASVFFKDSNWKTTFPTPKDGLFNPKKVVVTLAGWEYRKVYVDPANPNTSKLEIGDYDAVNDFYCNIPCINILYKHLHPEFFPPDPVFLASL